ncbi:MAG: UDP-glucose 4-epimerase GalE [Chitinophagales bacterium]|jgi:UDP-glucose 4-epimerase|nr:UDP-glucose 4-epimerase GalE [Chitinophagales bacterium]
MKHILITGGTGYIGSHSVVELIEHGYEPIIVDSLATSEVQVCKQIQQITGKAPLFHQVDICDRDALFDTLKNYGEIQGIIHFAAYKYVDESVAQPIKYYQNNIVGLINILEFAEYRNITKFVFSSSCSVYGDIDRLPVNETVPRSESQSPYGFTKQVGEDILRDYSRYKPIKILSLRYFNPVGAHESNLIGESPKVIPNNLVPRITGTAIGKFPQLKIFGQDYPTRDGTCIRDYIDIMDLARAHRMALDMLMKDSYQEPYNILNLGSGSGVSVLEAVKAFEKVSGVNLDYTFEDRRPGDVVAIFSDSSYAEALIGWKPTRNLEDMMRTAWQWELENQKKSK